MKPSGRRLGCLIVVLVGAVGLIGTWLYTEAIVDKSVLTDSPCAPPCWQGIVPGAAVSEAEVTQRLQSLPNVGQVWKPIGTAVAWYWKQWPWKGNTGANDITFADGTVRSITLNYDFELTLQEIVAKYGTPHAISAVQAGLPEHPYVAVGLFYPMRGLEFFAQADAWHPTLEPTTKVYEANYLVPDESLEHWEKSNSGLHLQPWPGYGVLQGVINPGAP